MQRAAAADDCCRLLVNRLRDHGPRLLAVDEPLPEPFMETTAGCPVCARDAQAIGRLALQVVFRCEHCRVVFKRNHSSPFDY